MRTGRASSKSQSSISPVNQAAHRRSSRHDTQSGLCRRGWPCFPDCTTPRSSTLLACAPSASISTASPAPFAPDAPASICLLCCPTSAAHLESCLLRCSYLEWLHRASIPSVTHSSLLFACNDYLRWTTSAFTLLICYNTAGKPWIKPSRKDHWNRPRIHYYQDDLSQPRRDFGRQVLTFLAPVVDSMFHERFAGVCSFCFCFV